jgi:uncharacterized protein YyaL (SSP411 family)
MKRRHSVRWVPTYTALDVLMASPTAPMPTASRTHQLTRMWEGLAAIERAPMPTVDDWRVCSDAVNLLETLIRFGELVDERGLLQDATNALAHAGKRRRDAGGAIRLDAGGILAVRAVLEDYAAAIETLPHRTLVHAHRITEKRIRAILDGKALPHDVEVLDL